MAVRTGASASNDQYWHPERASSEYTLRFALATKMRPPTMDGCPLAIKVSGKAKAHFSRRLDVSALVRRALAFKPSER